LGNLAIDRGKLGRFGFSNGWITYAITSGCLGVRRFIAALPLAMVAAGVIPTMYAQD
jgi:hypothetical protein